jgi:hypothetical protein
MYQCECANLLKEEMESAAADEECREEREEKE